MGDPAAGIAASTVPTLRIRRSAMRCVAALGALALPACEQVAYPDGRVGYSISPNSVMQAMSGQPQPVAQHYRTGQTWVSQDGTPQVAANDPYVQTIVPDVAVFRAVQTVRDSGLAGAVDTTRQCERDARSRTGDMAYCLAADMAGAFLNISHMNVMHAPSFGNLDEASSRRRWQLYMRSMGVPPDRYKLVEDGTFQRVFLTMTAKR